MKKIICIVGFLLGVLIIWMTASGFSVETTVFITDDFSVADDESEITFSVGIGASMGYVRGYKDEGGGGKPHYLKFYSAWGGFNSSLGAKKEFVLQLEPDDTQIYIYHGNESRYDLALEKNMETGEWYRVK